MAKSKNTKKILLILIVVLAGGVIAYFKFIRHRAPIVTVQTEKVKRRDVIELVEATGKVQPVLLVKISPEVSGEIIALPVKDGQKIRRGDLLMKIKPDFYAANRNQSQASFKSAAATRENSVANLAKAVAELKRNKELYEKKLISESAFLDVTTVGYTRVVINAVVILLAFMAIAWMLVKSGHWQARRSQAGVLPTLS